MLATVITGAVDWQLGSPGLMTTSTMVHIAAGVLALLALIWFIRNHSGHAGMGRATVFYILAAASGIATLLYVHRASGAMHAWLGLVTFAMAVLVVLPRASNSVPSFQEDRAWPSLRSVAAVLLAFEFIQATLGVFFRHGIFNIILPHAWGAVFVGVLTMYCVVSVFQQPHDALVQRAAKWTVFTLALQLLSGVGTFFVRVTELNPDNYDPGQAAHLGAVLHATNGGLFLASTLAFTTLILRTARIEASPHPRVHFPIEGS